MQLLHFRGRTKDIWQTKIHNWMINVTDMSDKRLHSVSGFEFHS